MEENKEENVIETTETTIEAPVEPTEVVEPTSEPVIEEDVV